MNGRVVWIAGGLAALLGLTHERLLNKKNVLNTAVSLVGDARAPAQLHASLPQPSRVSNPNRFYSEMAGFGVVKPSTWMFGTLELEQASQQAFTSENSQLDMIRRHASPPLVVILKVSEEAPTMSPSVRVMLTPTSDTWQGMSPKEMTRQVVAKISQGIPGFGLRGDVDEAVIGGRAAGHFKGSYVIGTVDLPPQRLEVLTQCWVVPRGNFTFIICATEPLAKAGSFDAEFSQILGSIELND